MTSPIHLPPQSKNAPTISFMALGQGIIVFFLWYLGIAFNYYMDNTGSKKQKDEGSETDSTKTIDKGACVKMDDIHDPGYTILTLEARDEDIEKIEDYKKPEPLMDLVDHVETKIVEEVADIVEEKADPVIETIVEPMIAAQEDPSVGEFLHEEIAEE